MSTSPVPAPAQGPPEHEKKSNLLWWLLGLLAIGIAVLGLGGVLIASYVLRNVRVQQSGSRVEIQTPVGEVKVSKDVAANPGLPVYPGATVAEAGATVEIGAPAEETVSIVAARYRTADPLPKVDDWYREQLGADFKREGPGVMVRKKDITGLQVKSSDVAFISEKDDLVRVVALERKGIYTEIALARIGKQETQ